MIHGGTHDGITPPEVECVPPYDALTVPGWLMLVEGAGHFTFSDTCTLLDLVGASLEALDDGCGDDDIPVAEAHALANRYATLFLRATLRADADAAALIGDDAATPPGVARFDAK
jgi:predicted dienelactone hydrolase